MGIAGFPKEQKSVSVLFWKFCPPTPSKILFLAYNCFPGPGIWKGSDKREGLHSLPPWFSIHGILQTRILEWLAISFSRESFWSRDQTHISWIAYPLNHLESQRARNLLLNKISYCKTKKGYIKPHKPNVLYLNGSFQIAGNRTMWPNPWRPFQVSHPNQNFFLSPKVTVSWLLH